MNWILKNNYNNIRYVYEYPIKNKLGEKITVVISKVDCDLKNKKSLMNLWVKNGFLSKPFENYWGINCNVFDSKGNEFKKYDFDFIEAQFYKNKCRGCRLVINFDWIIEATEENKILILNAIEKNFLDAEKYKRKTIRKDIR